MLSHVRVAFCSLSKVNGWNVDCMDGARFLPQWQLVFCDGKPSPFLKHFNLY